LSIGGGRRGISLTIKPFTSSSPLFLPKPSSLLALSSLVYILPMMHKTSSFLTIVMFLVKTPKSIQRQTKAMISQ
jgi:hypothetical protein